MAKSSSIPWISLIFGGISTMAMLAGGAMAYGTMQNKVESLFTDISKLERKLAQSEARAASKVEVALWVGEVEDLTGELERSKGILHTRISRVQQDVSDLKTRALERVTDVEVKITKLDSKIDSYSAAAKAAREEAQSTMNTILQRLQRDIPR
jgi:outer membrane murein-binding lipoprotein Lpp